MPSCMSTEPIVPRKHFRSIHGPRCLTYSPSSLALSGISSSSLPLICAHPVSPGVTSLAPYFSRSATRSAVRYCHIHSVKVYVTLNTIVFDDEMQRLKEAVLIAARADVDALIVQNMGVARLARQLVPSMARSIPRPGHGCASPRCACGAVSYL